MTDIIKVNNLSKKYSIGANLQYKVLREEIFKILNPFKQRATNSKSDFWALKNIDFTVEKGEILGIIGKNGAGKTTLLKILSNITIPTKGSIEMYGRVGSLLEVGTGFHSELTGRENIFLNGAILGMKTHEIEKKFDEIIDFAEIGDFLDTPVKRYSSGMTVRLAFAVAAHLDPEILIVDEVLSVGDYYFQQKSLGKMDAVAKEGGRTVLFVSHNLSVVNRICTKCIVLDHGEMKYIGPTRDAVDYYLNSIKTKDSKTAQIDRKGNGLIKVVASRFFNGEGRLVKNFNLGDSIRMEFDYKSKLKNAEYVEIGFTLSNEFSKRVANLSSQHVHPPFSLKSSRGTFVLNIPKMMLYPGVYSIYFIIRRKGIIEDKIKVFKEFTVVETNIFGQNDLPPVAHQSILFDYSWDLNNS